MQDVRIEVEPVGSDDRPQLGVDADLEEDGRVAERLSHRTPQIGGEVDDSFPAVIEDQTERVVLDGLDSGYGSHATDARPAGPCRRVVPGRGAVPVDAKSAATDRSRCGQKCGRKCGLRVHT